MSTERPNRTRRDVDPEELLQRLGTLAADRLQAEVLDLATLDGGRSSLTYRAVLRSTAGDHPVVVRLAPPGIPPVANRDVLRQARVLDVLARDGRVPVPAVRLTDAGDPPDVPPLYVMDLLDGRAVEPIFSASGDLPAPDLVRDRSLASARALAALHQVPTADLAADEKVVGIADEMARWERMLEAAGGSPQADSVRTRLRASQPAEAEARLVHGDFRLGNCLFVGSTLTAVLDWEIWALSDPRIDLAWLALTTMPDVHPGADRDPAGMPTTEALVAEYVAATGRPDAAEDLPWFVAMALFKMAGMARHIGKKFDADDPRRTSREAGAERMLEASARLL